MIVQVESARPLTVRGLAKLRGWTPGLVLAAAGTGVGLAVHAVLPGLPVVLVALVLGLVVGNAAPAGPTTVRPGLDLCSGALLKLGVVLLGFELALESVVRLGGRGLAVVVLVVGATFFGTRWAGRRLGLPEGLTLLVATGFSICGVSAIAAARGVTDADEEEVTYAVALVTLCGSLAIVVLPALQSPLGLDDRAFGIWAGASVHDVAQVVATSSAVGGAAVAAAIVVKLTRVLLLAPLVAGIGWSRGRVAGSTRVSLVPPFVVAFVGAALVRSADVVPQWLLDSFSDGKTVLLACALFAVGARVELRRLLAVGVRPLLLGLSSWLIAATVAYLGVRGVWA